MGDLIVVSIQNIISIRRDLRSVIVVMLGVDANANVYVLVVGAEVLSGRDVL